MRFNKIDDYGNTRIIEDRIENTTPLERFAKRTDWVDLGHDDVLFSIIDYDRELSISEIIEYEKDLGDGIHIMNKSHIKWIKDNCTVMKYDVTKYNCIRCVSGITGLQILFRYDDELGYYFINYNEKDKRVEYTTVGPNKFPSYLGTPMSSYIIDDSVMEEEKYKLKLVKEK